MAGIKIVDLPAVGRDLAATDLFEMSLAGGTGSRKITGQEIMNASKLSVNNTPVINGTSGRIFFQGSTNVLQQSSSLFWDSTNNRLGIGTSTPTNPIQLLSAANAGQFLKVQNTNGGANASAGYEMQSNTAYGSLFANPSAYVSYGVLAASQIGFYTNNTFAIAIDSATSDFRIGIGTAPTEKFRITNGGNVLINTTTDAGFRLDVNGTARVSSTVGQTLIVQSSLDSSFTSIAEFNASALSTSRTGFVAIGRNGATNNQASLGFFYSGNGSNSNRLDFGFYGTNPRLSILAGGNVLINTTTDDGFRLDVNGTARVQGNAQFGTGFYWDNTNARLGIGTSSPLAQFHMSNTGAGTNTNFRMSVNSVSANAISFTDTGGAEQGGVLGTGASFSFGTYRTLQTTLLGGLGGVGLRTGNGANAHISFYSGNADANLSTERVRLVASTGNLLINTTTDAGFKLDVNGTARVSGNTTIAGSGNLSVSNGVIGIDSNVAENNTYGNFNLGVNGSGGYAWVQSYLGRRIALNPLGNGVVVGSSTKQASAEFEVVSTSKGFLPPRMTQTQRNAIASPAIGLEIYQTDATEGKYIYKSSGWTYIG